MHIVSRLPTVNGDEGTWGSVLNDYLSQSLAADGTIRSNAVDTAQLKDGAVTAPKLVNGPATNGQVLTYTPSGLSWQTSSSAPVTSVAGRTGSITLSATDIAGLSTVATSGSYTDLANKPTIPTAGTGLTNTSGVLSVAYGTASGTAAAGNDSRISGALQTSAVTAKGDLLAGTGSSTVSRVGAGSDGQVLSADSSQATGVRWVTPTPAPVTSVAGRTGTVTLTATDVGLGNANNTSDANKPISTATQTALDLKAPLVSPALTGTPTAPTATAGTNTTQIASTAFVATAITNAALADATTSTKGKVQLADATDIANASGTDVLSAGQIPSAQGVTGIAKVQFIPNGGTVTGNPGPYTIIIEAGA